MAGAGGGLPSIALSWPITILCFQTTVVHTFSLLCMLSRRLRRSQVLLLANLALESQVIFLHIQFIWHFLRNWRRYRHLSFHYFSFWHNQTDRPSFQINRRPGPKIQAQLEQTAQVVDILDTTVLPCFHDPIGLEGRGVVIQPWGSLKFPMQRF